MSAATQVYYASFDDVFLKLSPILRARIERKIDEIGSRLQAYSAPSTQRVDSVPRSYLRLSNHYTFDLEQNKIHLLTIGHRREIYRDI